MYTTATAFLEALRDAGVEYIFANLGSDHTALIESLAEAKAAGDTMPRLITCPNEMVALSAAHGYAQATGRPQAVFVHVECGTQALAGAVHNAAKGRAPVLIFAGMSPMTQEGELRGSRNEFIHWLQDVFDQRGIVRQYMRYDNEIRTGVNVKQVVWRALQFARSDPQGPVYLTAAREVLEQEVSPVRADPADWPVVSPGAAAPEFIESLARDLNAAQRPLIVTSYAGRKVEAVAELVRLAERGGIGVLDSVPNCVNFPADHPMYQGVQGNEPRQSRVLAEADLVLAIDSDVPWMPTVNKPRDGAAIYHIDVDPLKERIPLWYIQARHIARADASTALRQVVEMVRPNPGREKHYAALHEEWRAGLCAREEPGTAEFLTSRIRRHLNDESVVLNEGITSYKAIAEHVGPRPPARMFTSGGGSLGWHGGAAIGFKLAWPEKTVVALTGDGSYLFSVPASVHWMARRYQTPFVQVIYNNGGWRSPRLSTVSVHPDGYASQGADIGVAFEEPADYAGIAAAAGGAFARTVRDFGQLDAALDEAFHAVRVEKRCAVLDVLLPRI
ncbi:MAG TPA: thiamine pyrophosphate-requiring protein [Bryobacteraceae bacterium]|nr:thiamine pyrophosphate-requiring protein [Bryobacteraceae bacterium]